MATRHALAKFVADTDWGVLDAVVCVGVGDGDVWGAIHEQAPDIPIFVFEPDEEKAKSVDLGGDNNTAIFWNLVAMRMALTDRRKSHWQIQAMDVDTDLGKAWNSKVVDMVRGTHLTSLMRENTFRRFEPEWAAHLLRTLPDLPGNVPINELRDTFKGRPGVVVGAGPSLDQNIETLAALQNRAVICAVNSSLLPLDRAGIRPHLCAVAESQPGIVRQFEGVRCLGDVTVVPGPHVNPGVYEQPARRFLPALAKAGTAGEWLHHVLRAKSDLLGGGSVSCLAFRLLDFLGCDPIILVGQDCAHGANSAHAEGSVTADSTHEVMTEPSPRGDGMLRVWNKEHDHYRDDIYWMVEGWGGIGKVLTPAALNVYRMWFESAALQHQDRRLINATEGGARIDGWEEHHLADVVGWYQDEFDAERIISDAVVAAEPIRAQPLIDALRGELDGLPALVETARKTREHVGGVIDAFDEVKERLHHAPLLGAFGTSTQKEVDMIPKDNAPFVALQTIYQRIEDQSVVMHDAVTEALEGLEAI